MVYYVILLIRQMQLIKVNNNNDNCGIMITFVEFDFSDCGVFCQLTLNLKFVRM